MFNGCLFLSKNVGLLFFSFFLPLFTMTEQHNVHRSFLLREPAWPRRSDPPALELEHVGTLLGPNSMAQSSQAGVERSLVHFHDCTLTALPLM